MKYLPIVALLILLVSILPARAGEKCYKEAEVTVAQTRDGSIAMPLNEVETASLIEGFRALYPDGDWSRDAARTSIAYILERNNIVRVIYFKDGCATRMTDVPMNIFFEVIAGTAPKKTGYEI